jgi:hypothetical protein
MQNKLYETTTLAAVGLALSLFIATPALAESQVKSTWYCYTNSYGQETCTEKRTEVAKHERVIVRELTAEEAQVVNEHLPLDTALTPAQITALMAVMLTALGAVAYKVKRLEVNHSGKPLFFS